MPRNRTYRSLSTGSYTDVATPDKNNKQRITTEETDWATAEQFLTAVLYLPYGKSFLHYAGLDLHVAQCLLERCHSLDEIAGRNHELGLLTTGSSSSSSKPSWLERFFFQPDEESGYTPLHSAILQEDISAILLLLEYMEPGRDGGRSRHRSSPISVLQAMDQIKDYEGLTPLGLLGTLQIPRMKICRQNLQHSSLRMREGLHGSINSINRTGLNRSNRSSSFDMPQDADEEVAMLTSETINEMEEIGEKEQSNFENRKNRSDHQCGFEVISFGRPHHCALGVVSGKTTSGETASKAYVGNSRSDKTTTFRPQRVQTFAQEAVLREGSAIAIAAATHHTLVACRNGDLYVFGVNKSGRLGLGDECPQQCPLPRQIRSLRRKHVVAIAAAENHSLCVTRDGLVWSWGNNQFGQLGDSTSTSNPSSTSTTSRSLPRAVEDLRKIPCVAVAAGERHSVALSQYGEVYVWGSNTAGQLGVPRQSGNQKVQRVDALWNNGGYQHQRKVAIAISAAHQSTLVLIEPTPGLAHVNSVYWFGHGNHVPMKVQFDGSNDQNASRLSISMTQNQRPINPIAVACAKYHNAAITVDGRVYTWGTSSESLGRSRGGSGNSSGKSLGHRVTVSPQLVTGMLPENGGGFAVAVSASEQHTAVVTNTGALFTWGVADENNAMGHEGVKWQPSPKRVPGVHRVASVAVAKEHTVVLVGTIFPSIPQPTGFLSLEMLAARSILPYVDLFNVLPILIMAEHAQCDLLVEYCSQFVRENLDGVLNVGKKSILKQFSNDMIAQSLHQFDREYRDGPEHPFIHDAITAGCKGRPSFYDDWLSDKEVWARSCDDLAKSSQVQLLIHLTASKAKEAEKNSIFASKRRRRFSSAGLEHETCASRGRSLSCTSENDDKRNSTCNGSVDRAINQTATMDLSNHQMIEKQSRWVAKEMRSIRKKLTQISKLRESEAKSIVLTVDEEAKISRQPILEAELHVYQTAMEEIEKRVKELAIEGEEKEDPHDSSGDKIITDSKIADKAELGRDEEVDATTTSNKESSFSCAVCGIKCPDSKSFELHNNGRKHRNKLAQLEENEKKIASELMMTQKQKEHMQGNTFPPPPTKMGIRKSAWGVPTSPPPKFKLPPPPHPVVPQVTSSKKKTKPTTKASSSPLLASSPTSHFKNLLHAQRDATSKAKTVSPGWGVTQAPIRKLSDDLQKNVSSPKGKAGPALSKISGSSSGQERNIETYSLADFLAPKPKEKSLIASTSTSWASPQNKSIRQNQLNSQVAKVGNSPIGRSNSSSSSSNAETRKKTLAEIQAEEAEFKAREDRAAEGEQAVWFVGRRERADSLHAIQEATEQEREMQQMIQEQMEIEAQIERERMMAAAAVAKGTSSQAKRPKGKKPGRRAKKQNHGLKDRTAVTPTGKKKNLGNGANLASTNNNDDEENTKSKGKSTSNASRNHRGQKKGRLSNEKPSAFATLS